MAIDSRDKRGSIIGLGLVLVLPLANSDIDQGDRQQTSHIYRGILAGTPIVVLPGAIRVSAITLVPSVDATIRVEV